MLVRMLGGGNVRLGNVWLLGVRGIRRLARGRVNDKRLVIVIYHWVIAIVIIVIMIITIIY